MAGLLKELQIPIYYAPEHVTGTLADVEDLNVTMKRNAMREFLSHRGAGHGLNLISIGHPTFLGGVLSRAQVIHRWRRRQHRRAVAWPTWMGCQASARRSS